MHELRAEYKENDCGVEIGGANPYLLLNLEMYCNCNGLKGLSHCDFVYVFLKGGEFQIFVVELKDLEEIKKEDLEKVLDDVANNKFPQTLSIMDELMEFLNIRHAKCYGILVLPPINQIRALVAHFRSKFVKLKRKRFNDAWIALCGESIWNRMF